MLTGSAPPIIVQYSNPRGNLKDANACWPKPVFHTIDPTHRTTPHHMDSALPSIRQLARESVGEITTPYPQGPPRRRRLPSLSRGTTSIRSWERSTLPSPPADPSAESRMVGRRVDFAKVQHAPFSMTARQHNLAPVRAPFTHLPVRVAAQSATAPEEKPTDPETTTVTSRKPAHTSRVTIGETENGEPPCSRPTPTSRRRWSPRRGRSQGKAQKVREDVGGGIGEERVSAGGLLGAAAAAAAAEEEEEAAPRTQASTRASDDPPPAARRRLSFDGDSVDDEAVFDAYDATDEDCNVNMSSPRPVASSPILPSRGRGCCSPLDMGGLAEELQSAACGNVASQVRILRREVVSLGMPSSPLSGVRRSRTGPTSIESKRAASRTRSLSESSDWSSARGSGGRIAA